MSARLRLVGWEIRPVLMIDDGEHLTPLPVQAQHIALKDWQSFKDGGDDAALAHIRAQVEQPENGK